MIPFQDERRENLRADVPATAFVADADNASGPYLVENLSAGGALLSGGPRFPTGAPVQVLLRLPERAALSVDGVVARRAKGDAFAVSFIHQDDEVKDAIHEIVLRYLERNRPENKRVLVVEKDDLRGERFGRQLQALSLDYVLTRSIFDAMSCLDDPHASFEAAIVNFEVGADHDGIELLVYLAKEHPAVRRILYSDALRQHQVDLARVNERAQAVIQSPERKQLVIALAPPPEKPKAKG